MRSAAETSASGTARKRSSDSAIEQLMFLFEKVSDAATNTATEVGGDFYDLRPEGDGLLVAFGDATGHGLAAGIVVTAAKALFTSLPAGASLPELVEPGANGLLFRSGDAGSLADACRRLLGEAPLAAALGRAARARFEHELAPERSTRRLLDLYAELVR